MKPLHPAAYPPMTSHQWAQVEGPRQVGEEVECDAEALWVPWDLMYRCVADVLRLPKDPMDKLRTLVDEVDSLEETSGPCGFTGVVDVAHWRVSRDVDRTEWACPRCGTVHEGELEHVPEPDRDER